jgi:hypothetical protein
MATMVNGSKIEQTGYEFAVLIDGGITLCLSYDVAKRLAESNDLPLKMRVIYHTNWQDAK